MASTPTEIDVVSGHLANGADDVQYQVSVAPSNLLKQESPSTFSLSQAPPPHTATDHRLLCKGNHGFQLPNGINTLGSPETKNPILLDDFHRISLIPSPARGVNGAAEMVPAARPLARSVSDPVPLSQFQNSQENNWGPGYVVGPRFDPNSGRGTQEYPSSKRLKSLDRGGRNKRMKQRIDEEDGIVNSTDKGKLQGEEEEVSAKREGGTTYLRFNCNCGSGFNILINAQTCYYKLI